ncbi:ESX secretion-associated protein EspG [Actinophytocola glycyrrhizae]|uniref:ESX secretion-associated protein EspG n=1 Tax=Actinophytocola glycyrrhizae TaxID=2044873 RepID=A0ABV9SEJ3_9PSEU
MTGYQLTLPEVDVLAQTLDVNVRQFPFDIPSFGEFQVDRQRIAREVFLGLGRRGLIRGADIDQGLTRALKVLSRPVISVATMGTVERTRKVYARAATDGEQGVLAVKEGERFLLEPIRPTALAISLVGLLPKATAGPGQSVTVTRPAPVSREQDDFMTPVYGGGGNDHQMRTAASYLARPRTGTGFFSVTGRDPRTGKELRGGNLTWIDTDAGRYLTLSRPAGEDGQVRSTFSPADSSRLALALGEMIESVAPTRR